MDQEQKSKELKSMTLHPGYKHCIDYVLSSQTMKFNEIAGKGAANEDILKALGGIDALKRFVGWIESSSHRDE